MILFCFLEQRVAERTEGRVKLKFYPGGIMGNDQSVLRKMRIGQIHGGALSGGAVAKLYPGAITYSLPFFLGDNRDVMLAREVLDPAVEAGLRDAGYELLGIAEGGFAHLFSQNVVHGVSDLPGRKIWVPEGDRVARAAFETAEVSPVQLPVSDVYTGLQTGLLDTVAINPFGAIALQWHTKVKYMIDRPLLFLMGFMVVSEKSMRKITADDRTVLRSEVSDAFNRLDAINRKNNEDAKLVLADNGIESVEVTEAEYQGWRAIANQVIADLVADPEFPGNLVKSVQDSLEQHRGSGSSSG